MTDRGSTECEKQIGLNGDIEMGGEKYSPCKVCDMSDCVGGWIA